MRQSLKTTLRVTLLTAGLGSILSTAWAGPLGNTVEPTVTAPLEKTPQVTLLIGNSYSFYNCGVHTYLRGLMQATEPKIPMKTRLLTISSGSLSFHDVPFYLKPHDQDPYGDTKDGELTHPMFDVVLLQDHSAAATSAKRIPFLKRDAKRHADTIRAAGSTPILIMTWTKADKREELGTLADNTIAAANDAGMRVVPVGLAFERARTALPDVVFQMPDKSHPTGAGTYLYAATLYASLFHRSPEGLDFTGDCEKPLEASLAQRLEAIAWETVKTFNHW